MILALLWLFGSFSAPPQEGSNPAHAHAQVEQALSDGRLAEAEQALAGADLPASARWRLTGRIALARGRNTAAAAAFERALALTPDDSALRLYLAQAHLEAGSPKRALEVLGPTAELAKTMVAQPLLLARAQLATGEAERAYATLQAATQQFPREPGPRLDLVALCSQTGLSRATIAWARSLLPLELDAMTLRALAATLSSHAGSIDILETILARTPGDPELRSALAYAYAAAGKPHAAAKLFGEATALGAKTAFAAADQFRVAGETAAALAMNARVRDKPTQLDQRLSILFGSGDMVRAIGLEPALLAQAKPTVEQRYRLAYAHYVVGEYARATTLARGLEATPYAAAARSLLGLMGRATGP